MTREEAIDFLECRRAYYASLSTDTNPHVKATRVCGYTLAESANACLMAIEALGQESKWIPVSERLPEKDKSVLLTLCANSSLYGFNENFVKVMCGSYSPCEDKRDWSVNEVRYYIDNVIAWMPLPEPYRAESKDKE